MVQRFAAWRLTVAPHRGTSPWHLTVAPHRGASPWRGLSQWEGEAELAA